MLGFDIDANKQAHGVEALSGHMEPSQTNSPDATCNVARKAINTD